MQCYEKEKLQLLAASKQLRKKVKFYKPLTKEGKDQITEDYLQNLK